MAIFFPPVPPVQTGGAQPYGQKKLAPSQLGIQVDTPPFTYGGPFALKAEIVSINQPNPWIYAFLGRSQPFEPRKLNPSITAVPVNDPPFKYGGPFASNAEIVSITQPNPWVYTYFGALQPFEPKKLSPAIPGQSINQPPFIHRGRVPTTAEVIAINQPDPWVYAFPGGWQPFAPRRLPPALIDVPVNNPPFGQRSSQLMAELISLNQPDPWTYRFLGWEGPYMPRHLPPFVEGAAGFYRVIIIL